MATANRLRVPAYRRHKPTGQAVVTLNGHDHYLGPWYCARSRQEYDRLISEWIANGRRLPEIETDVTVSELIAAYWKHAETYYQKNGRPTGTRYGIRVALRILRQPYGRAPAREFGPLALKALQQKMIDLGQSRRYINDNVDRIRRMFKWAVSEELVPAAVLQALQTVPGLRKGRTAARETDPIRPVSDADVAVTLPHMPAVVADMVRLQRLVGCRPSEVCDVRPCDIDSGGQVWVYIPAAHKTEHHGRQRRIFIGPKGQDVLQKYLRRAPDAYCFSPAESERNRKREMRERRKSKVQPSQLDRRKEAPMRKPSDRYCTAAYRRAINNACDKAFPVPADLPEGQHGQWRSDHRWAPNQLRHAAATEIRRQFGLEAAQVTLGHASADVSQIYAERDFAKAAAIMKEVG